MNSTFKKIYCVLLGFIIAMSVSAVPAYALAENYTLLEPLPCITGTEKDCVSGTIKSFAIEDYIAYVFNLFIGLAAVAAVFMIVWGGFEYMTTDSISGKSGGVEKAKNAVYGLLLVLGSYLLIQTINPKLVIIPIGLVDPIKIDAGRYSNTSFFAQLAQDVDNYGARSNEFVAAQRTQVTAATQAEQRLKEAKDKLDYLLYDQQVEDTDPEVVRLRQQIQVEENTIQQAKGKATVEAAKALMAGNAVAGAATDLANLGSGWRDTAGRNRGTEINKIITDQKANVEQFRARNNTTLASLGAYELQGDINQYADYTNTTLDLMKQEITLQYTRFEPGAGVVKVVYPDGTFAYIDQAKQREMANLDQLARTSSTLTDTALRAELDARIQTARSTVNARYTARR